MNAFTTAFIIALWLAFPAVADEKGGANVGLTLGFGGTWDKDPNLSGAKGSSLHALTSLNFNLSSITRTQALKFNLSTKKIGTFTARTGIGLEYEKQSRNAKLHASISRQALPAGVLDFTQSEKSDERFSDAFDLSPRLSKTRKTAATLRFQSGLERPVGIDFRYGIHRQKVDALAATGALWTDRQALKAKLKLRLDARTKGNIALEAVKLRTSGSSFLHQDSHRLGAGFERGFSQTTKIDFQLGWKEIEAQRTTTVIKTSGFEWQGTLSHRQKGSHWFAQIAGEPVIQGRVTELQFGYGRTAKKRNLNIAVGVAKVSGGSAKPTFTLGYREELDTGIVLATVKRRFVGSDETGETRMVTKAALSYQHDFGIKSRLDLSLDYQKTDATPLTTSRKAGRLRAAYHHHIKRDWSMVSGAQRRLRQNATGRKIGSTSVFVTFEHKFSGGL